MTVLAAILLVVSLISPQSLPPAQSGHPFSVKISAQHGVVKSGSEILVEITLTSTSNHEISLGKAPGIQPLAESEYIVEAYISKDQLAPGQNMVVTSGKTSCGS
jgi:hypothetical protein